MKRELTYIYAGIFFFGCAFAVAALIKNGTPEQSGAAPVKKHYEPAAPDSVYTEAEQRVFNYYLNQQPDGNANY